MQALDWCIESAGVLSEHDLLTEDPRTLDVERIKRDFDQFLQNYPAPTDEELHQLQELTEAIGNAWIKGNAEFAFNRVTEVSEKFQFYRRLLEGMVKDKRRHAEDRSQKSGQGAQVVGDTIHLVAGDRVGEEPEEVFLEKKSIPKVISEVHLKSTQQDMGKSLQYDDAGIGHALLLLENVAKNADRLDTASIDTGGYAEVYYKLITTWCVCVCVCVVCVCV